MTPETDFGALTCGAPGENTWKWEHGFGTGEWVDARRIWWIRHRDSEDAACEVLG